MSSHKMSDSFLMIIKKPMVMYKFFVASFLYTLNEEISWFYLKKLSKTIAFKTIRWLKLKAKLKKLLSTL